MKIPLQLKVKFDPNHDWLDLYLGKNQVRHSWTTVSQGPTRRKHNVAVKLSETPSQLELGKKQHSYSQLLRLIEKNLCTLIDTAESDLSGKYRGSISTEFLSQGSLPDILLKILKASNSTYSCLSGSVSFWPLFLNKKDQYKTLLSSVCSDMDMKIWD